MIALSPDQVRAYPHDPAPSRLSAGRDGLKFTTFRVRDMIGFEIDFTI